MEDEFEDGCADGLTITSMTEWYATGTRQMQMQNAKEFWCGVFSRQIRLRKKVHVWPGVGALIWGEKVSGWESEAGISSAHSRHSGDVPRKGIHIP